MTGSELVSKVKALNLPKGNFVVFGSGPLAIHDIRETNDIDLFITTALYDQLKSRGWQVKQWDSGGEYLIHEEVEADDSWTYNSYNPSPEELIAKAELIEGVPFAPLEEVLKWKLAFGRPKDLNDVKLINAYLADK